MCSTRGTPGAPERGKIIVDVLEDGTVRSVTGDLSGPQHQAADGFMQYLAQLLGGSVDEQRLAQGHEHGHDHSHDHLHH